MSEAQVMRELIRENDRLRARVAEREAALDIFREALVKIAGSAARPVDVAVIALEAAGQLRAKAPQ